MGSDVPGLPVRPCALVVLPDWRQSIPFKEKGVANRQRNATPTNVREPKPYTSGCGMAFVAEMARLLYPLSDH
jgi:hypothetical protein